MRSVSEMYGPRSRSFTYSARISVTPASISLSITATRQDLVGLGQDLAGLGVEHVVREDLADQVFLRHFQAGDVLLLELAHVTRGDAAAFLDDDFFADLDGERRRLAAQARRDQFELNLAFFDSR